VDRRPGSPVRPRPRTPLHVKFYNFTQDGEESTIDYRAFFSILRRKEYDAACSIELVPLVTPSHRSAIASRRCPEPNHRAGSPTSLTAKLWPLAAECFPSIGAMYAAVAGRLSASEAREFVEAIRRCAEPLNPDFEMRKEAIRKSIQVLLRYGARP